MHFTSAKSCFPLCPYGLVQYILTETSVFIIDLLLTRNISSDILNGVDGAFFNKNVRYHSPIYGYVFLSNPFLLHHLSLRVQLLPKNNSVLKRLISSAASSLSQLAATSRRRRKNFQ